MCRQHSGLTVCYGACEQATQWSDGAEWSTRGVTAALSLTDAGAAVIQSTGRSQHADLHVPLTGDCFHHLPRLPSCL